MFPYSNVKLRTIAKFVLNVHVVVFSPCGIVSYDVSVLAKYSMSIDFIQRCPPTNHIQQAVIHLLTVTEIKSKLSKS